MSSCAMAWPQHLPEPLLDASYKGYPLGAPPCAVGAVGEQGWNLLDGDLPLPLAVLDEAALDSYSFTRDVYLKVRSGVSGARDEGAYEENGGKLPDDEY